jgi:glycosyltransferase involved in cell wall biosynthesis
MEQHQPKKSLAIFYPIFAGGGAEAVTLWLIDALQADYNISLFTLIPIDLEALNQFYGTRITHDLTVRHCFAAKIAPMLRWIVANSGIARKFFYHYNIRFFKQHSCQYDVAISGYNAMDLGCLGIQYVHWVGVLENPNFYWVSKFSEDRMRQNLSIANSKVVCEVAQARYGGNPIVVYPPVAIPDLDFDWGDREDAFICSGRLTRPKEPHRVIAVLRQVREQGFPIKLYLTGGGGGMYATEYRRFLQKKIDENSDWVTLYENLSYDEYLQVLSRCRYGMHWKQEPFGISIAEMVKMGSIPFVRASGGQAEIVGENNAELMFNNEAEAVQRVVTMLASPEKQAHMRLILKKQAQLFSTERFSQEMRQVVATYLQQKLTQN